jgi:predicted O-methyltransferase YrrM
MNPPGELLELTKQLLSVQGPGIVVEVGCHQGWTTCLLLEALIEQRVKRDYVCIDTFSGFTSEDLKFEYEVRGKAPGLYDDLFSINDPEWLKAAVSHSGYTNVSVRKADAAAFDYQTLGQIAFAFVDLDLYRPVKASLTRILPGMARGGVIVVDDCNPADNYWDGAYHAYADVCRKHGIQPEIVCQKFGIIHT